MGCELVATLPPNRVAAWSWGSARIQVCGRLRWSSGRRLEDSLRGRRGVCCSRTQCSTATADPPRRLAEALWSGRGTPAYESLLAPPLSRLRKASAPASRGARRAGAEPAAGRRGRLERLARAFRAPAADAGDLQARGRRPARSRSPTTGTASRPHGSTRAAAAADLRVEALEALATAGVNSAGAAGRVAPRRGQAEPFHGRPRRADGVLRARGNAAEALRVARRCACCCARSSAPRPARAGALHERLLRDERRRPPAPGPPPRPRRVRGREREVALLGSLLATKAGETPPYSSRARPASARPPAAEARRHAAGGALVLNARAGELERDCPRRRAPAVRARSATRRP
jgi:hypothetical protein